MVLLVPLLLVQGMTQPAAAALESLTDFAGESTALHSSAGGPGQLFGGGCNLGQGAPEIHLSSLRLYGLPELACHSLAVSAGHGARWALGLRSFGWEEWQENSLLFARSAKLHPSLAWSAGLGLHRISGGEGFSRRAASLQLELDQSWQGGGMSLGYRRCVQQWAGLEGLRLEIRQKIADWTPRVELRSSGADPLLCAVGMAWHLRELRCATAWLGERGWRYELELPLHKLRFGVLCWAHPFLPPSLCFSFSCSL